MQRRVLLNAMAASHDPASNAGNDAEQGSEEENEAEEVARVLRARLTAEELRRLAAHLPDASRERGANKKETSLQIAERSDKDLLALVAGDGRYKIECSCGLKLSPVHPQVARREAQEHKSRSPVHFPSALDRGEGDDADPVKLYG